MQLLMSLYVALLFVLLTPGILLRLPKRGSPLVVAVVHGIVFTVVLALTHNFLSKALYIEGFVKPRTPAVDLIPISSEKPRYPVRPPPPPQGTPRGGVPTSSTWTPTPTRVITDVGDVKSYDGGMQLFY